VLLGHQSVVHNSAPVQHHLLELQPKIIPRFFHYQLDRATNWLVMAPQGITLVGAINE
jgi:hypothetical protein